MTLSMRSSSVSEVLSVVGSFMGGPQAKKNRQAFGLAVFRICWVSLAGPVRPRAGIKEETEEEPVRHGFGFCHKTIWVHLKRAILAPVASLVTTASQTWVVRPRWTGVARQAI